MKRNFLSIFILFSIIVLVPNPIANAQSVDIPNFSSFLPTQQASNVCDELDGRLYLNPGKISFHYITAPVDLSFLEKANLFKDVEVANRVKQEISSAEQVRSINLIKSIPPELVITDRVKDALFDRKTSLSSYLNDELISFYENRFIKAERRTNENSYRIAFASDSKILEQYSEELAKAKEAAKRQSIAIQTTALEHINPSLVEQFLTNDLKKSLVRIECPKVMRSSVQASGGSTPTEQPSKNKLTKNLLLRGNVNQLASPRPTTSSGSAATAFNALDPALISFTNNSITDTTVFSTRFTLGLNLSDYLSNPEKRKNKTTAQNAKKLQEEKGEFGLIPYLSFEYSDTDSPAPEPNEDGEVTPASNSDIFQLSPGLLVTYDPKKLWKLIPESQESQGFAIDSDFTLGLQNTFDLEQDAETLSLNLGWQIQPTILGRDGLERRLCGFARFQQNLPIVTRCDLNARARIAHVFDAGTSMDLQDVDDDQFVLLGGEVGYRIWPDFDNFPGAEFLNSFSASASYSYLGNVAGALEDQDRFNLALGYSPQGLRFTEISLSYEEGNNTQTFQEEGLFRLSFGVRY